MKQKIFTVLCVLLAIVFINAGLDKFFHYMPVPENLPEALVRNGMAISEVGWLLPLIATAELTGGLLILFRRTRALGVLVLFPVVVGIMLTNTLVDTSGLVVALPVFVMLLWIIYENREKYLGLVR